MAYTNVNFLILILYYSCINCNHWRNLFDGYMGPLWTILWMLIIGIFCLISINIILLECLNKTCSWTRFFQSLSAWIRDQHTWIWYAHLSLLMGRPHSCWAYQISGPDSASYLVPNSHLKLEFLLSSSLFCWAGHYISCHLALAKNSLFCPLFFPEEVLVIFNRTCDIGGLWSILVSGQE